VRCEAHAGFGRRPGETRQWQHRQGAPGRPHTTVFPTLLVGAIITARGAAGRVRVVLTFCGGGWWGDDGRGGGGPLILRVLVCSGRSPPSVVTLGSRSWVCQGGGGSRRVVCRVRVLGVSAGGGEHDPRFPGDRYCWSDGGWWAGEAVGKLPRRPGASPPSSPCRRHPLRCGYRYVW
jgi:hypothetical protein